MLLAIRRVTGCRALGGPSIHWAPAAFWCPNPRISPHIHTHPIARPRPSAPEAPPLHTREVAGSKPAAPIRRSPANGGFRLLGTRRKRPRRRQWQRIDSMEPWDHGAARSVGVCTPDTRPARRRRGRHTLALSTPAEGFQPVAGGEGFAPQPAPDAPRFPARALLRSCDPHGHLRPSLAGLAGGRVPRTTPTVAPSCPGATRLTRRPNWARTPRPRSPGNPGNGGRGCGDGRIR